MSVKAKFKCTYKVNDQDGGCHRIRLEPVIDGSEENKQFFKYTPSGIIEIGTVNEAAAQQFNVGAECYVTFDPVDMCAEGFASE